MLKPPTYQLHLSTRITPSTPSRKHPSFLVNKFYDHVQVLDDLRIRSQVVRNCGHGFSKRLNPAGVYNFNHTYQPTLNANVLALAKECRQRVVDHDLYLG